MTAYEKIFQRLSESAKISRDFEMPSTYLNVEDGLHYCSKCHTPRQTRINFPAEGTVVWCDCKCISEYSKVLKEHQILCEEYENLSRIKRDAFPAVYAEARCWKFELDDRQGDGKSMQIIRNYAENFDTFYKKGAGLLIYGEVGTGKSFASACVVNALLDKGISCFMTDFSSIINEMTGMFQGKQDYINRLISYDLLVIDDLGVQRDDKPYAKEIVTNVVNARTMSKKPMIVTTNFTQEELLYAKDIYYKRILSRLFEQCIPIDFKGIDRRMAKNVSGDMELRRILGL